MLVTNGKIKKVFKRKQKEADRHHISEENTRQRRPTPHALYTVVEKKQEEIKGGRCQEVVGEKVMEDTGTVLLSWHSCGQKTV
ncbi:MAG: hypothetical protein K5981_07820, partial [Clostridia bacterium]|nr:hypothetical protein [Clostridia bacterium]